MKTFKWIVEFEVSENWVADGFNLNDEQAHQMLCEELPYAYGSELKARVISAPSQESLMEAQGDE